MKPRHEVVRLSVIGDSELRWGLEPVTLQEGGGSPAELWVRADICPVEGTKGIMPGPFLKRQCGDMGLYGNGVENLPLLPLQHWARRPIRSSVVRESY